MQVPALPSLPSPPVHHSLHKGQSDLNLSKALFFPIDNDICLYIIAAFGNGEWHFQNGFSCLSIIIVCSLFGRVKIQCYGIAMPSLYGKIKAQLLRSNTPCLSAHRFRGLKDSFDCMLAGSHRHDNFQIFSSSKRHIDKTASIDLDLLTIEVKHCSISIVCTKLHHRIRSLPEHEKHYGKG